MTHPRVPLDAGALAEIGARLDLRAPNAEALEVLARRFDQADGEPFEAVCDIATAVGKTYLAAGLIDYLSAAGVRTILVVVPGSTILRKTVADFTAGSGRSLVGGMAADPVVVTADNFASGHVAAALEDPDRLKLLVFTVQSLINPRTTVNRRTRRYQEWLGTGLYQHLQGADDLVVIADEHHVYSESAAAFHAAVRDLDPMALVGLTATPSPDDADAVVYRYPLARAIADEYVKTPVLVGRKDHLTGVEVQLRDGLRLLDAKQAAADRWCDATGAAAVNAVMFVVADTIDNANAIHETLRKADLLGEHYDQQVLVVHSDAPDEALARLETVEDPASPVRVIVSVSMLKEGWDVKNIYVICSFRPSISEALTEQTLGRGMRLPWGAYTGVELLDTVEVLSHERYQQLLERAGVLIEGLTVDRAETSGQVGGGDDGRVHVGGAAPGARAGTGPVPDGRAGGVRIADTEGRQGDAQRQSESLVTPVVASTRVAVPRLDRVVVSRHFSLSDIDDGRFRQLGARLAAEGGIDLDRKILNVVADPADPSGFKLVPRTSTDRITASEAQLGFEEAQRRLVDVVLSFDEVEQTRANVNAARRLAAAVVDGAGSESALAAQFNGVVDAVRVAVRSAWRASEPTYSDTWSAEDLSPTRVNTRPEEPNRFGPFSRDVAYSGWQRSMHPLNWFDSSTERSFANLIDDDPQVHLWARILRHELAIPWDGGRHFPDFYVHAGGIHRLAEVKGNDRIDDGEVLAKRDAAQQWARRATDEGDHGTWEYVLVSQAAIEHASTLDGILRQAL